MRTPPPGTSVTVRVPATSANLGPGFDCFGLALALYDEVSVRVCAGHGRAGAGPVAVEVSGEGAGGVPRDETHLVARALLVGLQAAGVRPPPMSVSCCNRIPHGRGLGSSAAAIIAGLLAARALTASREEAAAPPDSAVDEALLSIATRLEGHPDNVAACLLGGFALAWVDGTSPEAAAAHAVRLEPAPGLSAVVFVPERAMATEHARALLPSSVPHADATHSAGRAALMVAAMTSRPDLLLAATQDRLHQDYRAAAMPATAGLVARLRAGGVPAVVSGAGPSVLALVEGTEAAAVAARAPERFVAVPLDLDLAGASRRVEVHPS